MQNLTDIAHFLCQKKKWFLHFLPSINFHTPKISQQTNNSKKKFLRSPLIILQQLSFIKIQCSHNLVGIFVKNLFQRPVNICSRPLSRSLLSSAITSAAFWLRNIFNDADNTLLPLKRFSRWIRIVPTTNTTRIWSMCMASCGWRKIMSKKSRSKLSYLG